MKYTTPHHPLSPLLQLQPILIGPTSPQTHTTLLSHDEIFQSFAELFFLLRDLAVITPQNIMPQSSVAGEWFEQARLEGHSEESIAFMAAMPGLDVDVEIEPCVVPVVTFDRELLGDGTWQIPAWAVRLSEQVDGGGRHLIYDLGTKMMTYWDPIAGDDRGPEPEPGIFPFEYVTQHPVREVMGPLIEKWRTLEYLATPDDHFEFWPDRYDQYGRSGPEGLGELELRCWEADYDYWEAVRGIKDIYLECGWDVENYDEQVDFEWHEFLGRRGVYWEQVVEPLAEEKDRLWGEKRERDRIANEIVLRQMEQDEMEKAGLEEAVVDEAS